MMDVSKPEKTPHPQFLIHFFFLPTSGHHPDDILHPINGKMLNFPQNGKFPKSIVGMTPSEGNTT